MARVVPSPHAHDSIVRARVFDPDRKLQGQVQLLALKVGGTVQEMYAAAIRLGLEQIRTGRAIPLPVEVEA